VSGYDREHFYHMLLAELGAPVNAANVRALTAWGECEGSAAQFNPLDTTQHEPGATEYNTFGNDQHVWNYPDEATGVRATVTTLRNGFYLNIVEALMSGTGEIVSGDARSEMRVWGTNPDCVEAKLGASVPTHEPPAHHGPPRPLSTQQREFITRAQRALDSHLHPLVPADRKTVDKLRAATEKAMKR